MNVHARHSDPAQAGFEQDVAARVAEVRQRIDAALARSATHQVVKLVAVTKTHGVEAVRAAWHAGVYDVGENKVQEAEPKMDAAGVPVRWHLIGHLQRNKARAATRFDLVHSIDSARLAIAVDRAARDAGRIQDVLVQVNVSGEGSKGGIAPVEFSSMCESLHQCPNLRVGGVMTMAPFDAPEVVLRSVFSGARALLEQLVAAGFPGTELSMGMSDDFEVAVEEGATLVRLGTVLFGHRATP